jgi:hypothetical protein
VDGRDKPGHGGNGRDLGIFAVLQKCFRRLSHGAVPSRHVFGQGLKKENDHETETEPVCCGPHRNAGLA